MKKNGKAIIKKPKRILFLAVLALLSVFIILFATRAAKSLVIHHEAESADMLMVLMGPIPDRVLQAADLYHREVAAKIVFCNDQQPGAPQLAARGIYLDNTSDIAKKTLSQLGVPKENIQILDCLCASTQEEAMALREFLIEHPEIKSVVVVTSSYHSKRTHRIFRKAIPGSGLDVEIYISENPYTSFRQLKWWRDRPSARMVVLEYLKLLNFYLIEQHRL